MLGMEYFCPGIGNVRLMVGVRRRDKTKIQYCITALTPVLEVKDEEKVLIFKNNTFVITGKLNDFKNRTELKEYLELLGGKVVDTVSSKTSYLINNDIDSANSKNVAGKRLGIPIITEKQLAEMIANLKNEKNV